MKDFCHLESNDRALINHVLSLNLKTTLLHYRLLLFYRLCLARCIISIAIKHFKFSRPVSRVCLKNKNNNNQVATNLDERKERKTSTRRSGRWPTPTATSGWLYPSNHTSNNRPASEGALEGLLCL